MIKKTKELTGPALDWAVDKAEGHIRPDGGYYCGQHGVSRRYSTDWSQAGPIIERERIAVQFGPLWTAVHSRRLGHPSYGPTPLVAAMRCFVAFHLGAEVDVPDTIAALRERLGDEGEQQ